MDKKVTIIFGILCVLFLVGIVWGVKAIVRTADDRTNTAEPTTEETYEIAEIETTETTTTEQTTEEITTEATTEEVTEATTEELIPTVEEDKDAPVFFILPKSCEVRLGEAFDVGKVVGYGDDMDRNPVLTVEGAVDSSVLGSYPLTLTLTDWAGHVTSSSMTVNVVSERTPASERARMDFATFQSIYKNENTTLGIDVSRWQEDVDYTQVKNAGCDFVIIRIGGFDDGSLYEDRYYKKNIANAKAAGLKVGIYWHAEEENVREIKENVAYMMDILGGEELDFPIAYDWEDFGGFQNYDMNMNDLNNCFEAFCREVNSYGYDACLYSSKNFLEYFWTNVNRHPVWLANYTSQTTYAGEYYMWQQGNTGRIPGINGDVDFDIWYHNR